VDSGRTGRADTGVSCRRHNQSSSAPYAVIAGASKRVIMAVVKKMATQDQCNGVRPGVIRPGIASLDISPDIL